MKPTNQLPIELLRSILRCEPATGHLFWLERPVDMFNHKHGKEKFSKWWNNRYAGQGAFTYIAKTGYHQGPIFNRKYLAHRVLWALVYGEWPVCEIDHINGVRSDNRISNLRMVTRQENQRNKRLLVSNTTGYHGVQQCNGRWKASINVNRQYISLGSYAQKCNAVAARKRAEVKYGFHKNHGK